MEVAKTFELTIINQTTQDDITTLMMWAFGIAIILGVLGFILGMLGFFRHGR